MKYLAIVKLQNSEFKKELIQLVNSENEEIIKFLNSELDKTEFENVYSSNDQVKLILTFNELGKRFPNSKNNVVASMLRVTDIEDLNGVL